LFKPAAARHCGAFGLTALSCTVRRAGRGLFYSKALAQLFKARIKSELSFLLGHIVLLRVTPKAGMVCFESRGVCFESRDI
jgi:hypothetical protein